MENVIRLVLENFTLTFFVMGLIGSALLWLQHRFDRKNANSSTMHGNDAKSCGNS